MSLDLMRNRGISLPPIENEDGLSAREIMEKIRSFYTKLSVSHTEIDDFAESYFLELLKDYPKSMCAQHMTDSIKQLITIIYFESKPNPEPENKDDWPGYSYEHLALMFDRSKATIHEAIHQKETEVKLLLQEAQIRQQAKKIALEELVKEEKEKLKLEQNNQKNEHTTERTP